MNIEIKKTKKVKDFNQIDNKLLFCSDEELTDQAFRMLMRLLSHPEFSFHEGLDLFKNKYKYKKDKWEKYSNELESKGYIYRNKKCVNGKWVWCFKVDESGQLLNIPKKEN